MLAHMQIQNFAIVKALELDFNHGMTTITGETGAGKSIAIDALGLCLGDRTDTTMIRPNEEKAEIIAIFHLGNNSSAKKWLEENELFDGDECILRRVITKEGRSRAFINGRNVPASQQKALGQYLINIHGQHEHQRLMRADYQLFLLDQYAGHKELLQGVQQSYRAWRKAYDKLKLSEKNKEALEAHRQLLEYQVKELNELAISENEYQELEQEHKRLSNSGDIAQLSQAAMDVLCDNDENNALHLLKFAQQKLKDLIEFDAEFTELSNLLDEACIQVQEAQYGISSYIDKLEMDPARLNYLDERIAFILRLARKHHVSPNALYQTYQNLTLELENLADNENQIEQLKIEVEQQHAICLEAAQNLSQSRIRYAKKLDKLILQSMQQLSMPDGQFHISLTHNTSQLLSPIGIDHIEFLVSTNPGQPMQALGKVASGGELSRISLAIQVITAQKVETPSLIFDEVDVGISGPTAMIVGKLLRKLGGSTQVICVTHLPQVAGCGHQQLYVNKSNINGATSTQMIKLDPQARINELARLLGGSEITAHTLANAKELIIEP